MGIMSREELLADICRMSIFINKALELENVFFLFWLPNILNNQKISDDVHLFGWQFGSLLNYLTVTDQYKTALKSLISQQPNTEIKDSSCALSALFDKHPKIERFLKNNIHRLHPAFDKNNIMKYSLSIAKEEIPQKKLPINQQARIALPAASKKKARGELPFFLDAAPPHRRNDKKVERPKLERQRSYRGLLKPKIGAY